jgi:phosphoglycerate dehydrogenase-like enzyme
MAKSVMGKPNLLAVIQPDHYALRNLDPIRDDANIFAGATPSFLAEHGPSAEITLYSGLGGTVPKFAEVWPHIPNCRWVHSMSAGVEKILIPELIGSAIPLTNARGVFKRSLADFVLLGALYFAKLVPRLLDGQRAHRWDSFSVEWIPDKVMGIVGYGEIGRECGRLAKAVGMKVHAVRRQIAHSASDPMLDRIYPPSELNAMLAECDFVVAAAPLTPETHHLLSDEQFKAMKPSAVVMNVGRGPVIDEAALIRALQGAVIAGAALDVFETEPLPADSPLWDMQNVLISPHCTDRTHNPDWLDLSMQLFVRNFRHYVAGEPLENIVNKEAGY